MSVTTRNVGVGWDFTCFDVYNTVYVSRWGVWIGIREHNIALAPCVFRFFEIAPRGEGGVEEREGGRL